MKPPWTAHPEIPSGMGWRMGFGASYSEEFAAWFGRLDATAQEQFIEASPEPEEWRGYYQNIIEYWVDEE